MVLVYQAEHVSLSEPHRNVPDHNRRKAFFTVQNTIKVYLVTLWGCLILTYHVRTHEFAFGNWSRYKHFSSWSVCGLERLVLRLADLHVHEPLLEIDHFGILALRATKLLWTLSLGGRLLREGALKLLRLLLKLLVLLGEVAEIHRGLGKLLEPLEHFLLVLHLKRHLVLRQLISVVIHVIGWKLIVLRNTLICEVVVSRILMETHLHLLKEKLLLRLHFLLVLDEGSHHGVKLCLLLAVAVRKGVR